MELHRWGNFTSSEIWKLCEVAKDGKSFGKPALTYIKTRGYEIMIQRPIATESNNRATLWGTFVETRVHNLLPLEYILCSQERLQHPVIQNWSGAPDLLKSDTVCDIKCPQLLSFCELVEIFKANDVEKLKKDYPEYYWQLVSNAILTNVSKAELIVYVPYDNEVPVIKTMMEDADDPEKWKSLYYTPQSELPYLPNDCPVMNLNIFTFDIPNEDKEFLTNKVNAANEILFKETGGGDARLP